MNWYLSRLFWLGPLLLFFVFGLCGFVVCFLCVWCLPSFVFWSRFCDDLLDCTQVLYQFTLDATQSAVGHFCTN